MTGGDSAQHPMMDAVALQLSRWGLGAPAVFLLELHRPYFLLVGQFAILLQPLLGVVVGDESVRRLAAWLSNEDGVNCLISHIERGDNT
jgi:hypothetical protein